MTMGSPQRPESRSHDAAMQRGPAQARSDAAVYDTMYLSDDRTYDAPASSPYMPMFKAVVAEAHRRGMRSIIEVGCGSGTLARMLLASGVTQYSGFDIAAEGVRKAKLRSPDRDFFVGDATDPAAYARDYEGVVCVEVLEHIDNDLGAIALWKQGAPVVCSVPNFDYATHVRYFRDEEEVRRRYGQAIAIDRIERVKKPVWTGLSLSQYLRRLRWARDDWRALLGLLGVNSFDWHAGWFVFSGTKR